MERKFPKLEPLPKEETPPPFVIKKREKVEEKPEVKPEEKPEETPAIKTTVKTEEKPDPDALAEALIMSHTAKTKAKSKHNGLFMLFGVFIGLGIAVAVLFFSGVLKFEVPKTIVEEKFPSTSAAKIFCESHEKYKFGYLYEDEDGNSIKDATPFIGGEEIKEYVSGQWACSPERTEELSEEANFDFIYMGLSIDYKNNEALKNNLAILAEYQTTIKNEDDYFIVRSSSGSPYIYTAAYKSAVVQIYAEDTETAENILKELNFPV